MTLPETIPSPASENLAEACARHEGYLRGRLRRLGVGESGLDDAVQDVFEVLVRRIGVYDSRFSLRQWMAGVARKIARRHRERSLRAPEAIEVDRVPSALIDPEGWTSRQEALARLQEFLQELGPDRWAVFVLSEIEGLRGTEIAAELDVNLSTVYARLKVARAAFARAMARGQRGERRSWLLLPWWGDSAFVTPIVLVGLLAGLGGVVAIRGCAGPADSQEREAAMAVVVPARHERAERAPAMAGVQARAVDSAAAVAERARVVGGEEEGWIAAGSGVMGGEDGAWSHEVRYRMMGGEVVLEIEYLGDDDAAVQGAMGWVTLEGLRVQEGPPSWPITLAAEERQVVRLRLRTTRDGVIRVGLHHGRRVGEATGSAEVWLVREGGRLRRCYDRNECARGAESVADSLTGEPVRLEVRNACAAEIEVVLIPCELAVAPPDAQGLLVEAGGIRAITIDGGLCLGRRGEDGRLGGHVGGSDGSVVRFSGEHCDSQEVFSKDMP